MLLPCTSVYGSESNAGTSYGRRTLTFQGEIVDRWAVGEVCPMLAILSGQHVQAINFETPWQILRQAKQCWSLLDYFMGTVVRGLHMLPHAGFSRMRKGHYWSSIRCGCKVLSPDPAFPSFREF
eukprot:2395477-Amphidinium_carterae.1